MRKLTVDDIVDHRAYERERDDFRAAIIAMKKRRRIALGEFITIEREDRHAVLAERYIARAGLAAVVQVRRGRALDVLPSLDGEQFDLVFLDADRAPLATYFEWAMRLVRAGGVIVAHNALLGGRVANA